MIDETPSNSFQPTPFQFPNDSESTTSSAGALVEDMGKMGAPIQRKSDPPSSCNAAAASLSYAAATNEPNVQQTSQFQAQHTAAGGVSVGSQMDQLLADPVAQWGMRAGKDFAQQKVGWLFSMLQLPKLKYYFTVSNKYVLRKLQLLIFPCFQKEWSRKRDMTSDHDAWQPPISDNNAPDLYIPIMAFVTYTLLIGYADGLQGKFTPEKLVTTASQCFLLIAFEILLVKLTFYIANYRSPSFLDLAAYCGYKYAR